MATNTFGNMNYTAISLQYSANTLYGMRFRMYETGTPTKITVYCSCSGNIKCAIYDDDAETGKPKNLVAYTEAKSSLSLGWHDFIITWRETETFTRGYYHLIFWSDSGILQYPYQVSPSVDWYAASTYGESFPDPFPEAPGYCGYIPSIYCTYTVVDATEFKATLHEQIDASVEAVADWIADVNLVWYGLFFGKTSSSDLDTVIAAYQDASNWIGIARTKTLAEILNYNSTTIDTAVKAFLTGQPMFTNYALPKNYGGYFDIGFPYFLYGYRWAKQLSFETAKWDAISGYNGLHAVFETEGQSFYRCNVDNMTADRYWESYPRIYEHDQLANCFLNFFLSSGITEALSDVAACWNYLNTSNWYSAENYFIYIYSSPYRGYVWDSPEMLTVFGLRHEVEPLDNWTRIFTHINSGYLQNNWTSKHWLYGDRSPLYYYVVHHNKTNAQRRIPGSTLAWILLHQVFRQLNTTQQTTVRDMLTGNGMTQAWQGLRNYLSDMFDPYTNKFKGDSTELDVSDSGTAQTSVLMILLGVIPSTTEPTGYLAIPLRSLSLGSTHAIDPVCFGWNSTENTVTLPIFAGNLDFQYGSETVTYNFPHDGVYKVKFTSDYNNIVKVTKLYNLPFVRYFDKPLSTGAVDPDADTMFQNLINQFGKRGMVVEVTWRRLILGITPDWTTGWFPTEFGESTITGILFDKSATSSFLGAGSYGSLSYTFFTLSQVEDGDRIVFNGRVYAVKEAQPIYKGEKLLCRRVTLDYLPFEETS